MWGVAGYNHWMHCLLLFCVIFTGKADCPRSSHYEFAAAELPQCWRQQWKFHVAKSVVAVTSRHRQPRTHLSDSHTGCMSLGAEWTAGPSTGISRFHVVFGRTFSQRRREITKHDDTNPAAVTDPTAADLSTMYPDLRRRFPATVFSFWHPVPLRFQQ